MIASGLARCRPVAAALPLPRPPVLKPATTLVGAPAAASRRFSASAVAAAALGAGRALAYLASIHRQAHARWLPALQAPALAQRALSQAAVEPAQEQPPAPGNSTTAAGVTPKAVGSRHRKQTKASGKKKQHAADAWRPAYTSMFRGVYWDNTIEK